MCGGYYFEPEIDEDDVPEAEPLDVPETPQNDEPVSTASALVDLFTPKSKVVA